MRFAVWRRKSTSSVDDSLVSAEGWIPEAESPPARHGRRALFGNVLLAAGGASVAALGARPRDAEATYNQRAQNDSISDSLSIAGSLSTLTGSYGDGHISVRGTTAIGSDGVAPQAHYVAPLGLVYCMGPKKVSALSSMTIAQLATFPDNTGGNAGQVARLQRYTIAQLSTYTVSSAGSI